MSEMIDDPNKEGVKQGEATPPASPAGDSAAQSAQGSDGQPAAPNAGEGDGKGTAQTVPYKRFKEVDDELKALKTKMSASDLSKNESGAKGTGDAADDDKKKEVRDRVQELVPILREQGFVTKDDQEVKARADDAVALAKTHDGTDGLPAFNVEDVTNFMKKERYYGSYEGAYRLLHHDAIVAKAVQDAVDGNTGQVKPKGGSAFSDAPKKGVVTREGIAKMPLSEYHKMGGSNALKPQMISGAIQ